MVSIPNSLGDWLDNYDCSTSQAGEQLQKFLISSGREVFRRALEQAFVERGPSEAWTFAAGLLDVRDLAQMLLEIHLQSRESAIAMAEKLAAADARFDAALFACLRDTTQRWSDEAVLVGLDILDTISERDRLVLSVLRLLRDPNPKLRSKAALFVAKRRPQLKLVTDLSEEADARVRANTLESFFGVRDESMATLFQQYLSDENNRVAGNAALGLYLLGEPSSIQVIERMAKDERSAFRNTAVWIMGRTGDPRFASNLASQVSDPDKLVRRQVLLSLGRIKDALKTARAQSPMRINIMNHRRKIDMESLLVTLFGEDGQSLRGVPGTGFIVKANGAFVREYTVEELDCNHPVEICFIECMAEKEEDSISSFLEQALPACLALKRVKDRVVTSQLDYDTQRRCFCGEAGRDDATLKKALGDVDFSAPKLHLILVGAAREQSFAEKLVQFGLESAATTHLIAAAAEWQSPELTRLVEDRGGFVRCVHPDELAGACLDIHSALLHHYQLDWHPVDGGLELEVRANHATGFAALTA